MAFVRLSNLPTPPATRVCNIPSLAGGLNLHDAPWRLRDDQSHEMKNMWWQDGLLRSRPAQVVSAQKIGSGEDAPCACSRQPFKDCYFVHSGTAMWAVAKDLSAVYPVDCTALTRENEDPDGEELTGLPEDLGTFFAHDGELLYKTRFVYAEITGSTKTGFKARNRKIFIPTLLINADPEVAGAGHLYQPINRLSREFYVTYSPKEDGTEAFAAPYFDVTISDVHVQDDDGYWRKVKHSQKGTGKTRQKWALITDPSEVYAGENTVRITYKRLYDEWMLDYLTGPMACSIAAVYGGGGTSVVLAGSPEQPNAYFWSANTDVAMDPTYFPTEHYNLAGDASDPITALGLQQNQLVIFQQGRVGAAEFGTADIDERTFITMNYRTINSNVGCDLPGSVQLVENNLVFANRKRGVLLLRDTTSADENNIIHISDNIERDPAKDGLLYDLQQIGAAAVSMDDGERYWLMVGQHAWLWDYRLGGSVGTPHTLSWFYFDGIDSPACVFGEDGYVSRGGSLCRFAEHGNEGFESVLTLPVPHFGTYAVRKDIAKILFSLDGSAEGEVAVEYIFDHGQRQDPTPLVCTGGTDLPIAFVRRPRCLDVQHFFCRLRSYGQMAFASAQIHYVFRGKER